MFRGSWLWEAPFGVFYEVWRLRDAQFVVFYVSGRLWEAQFVESYKVPRLLRGRMFDEVNVLGGSVKEGPHVRGGSLSWDHMRI